MMNDKFSIASADRPGPGPGAPSQTYRMCSRCIMDTAAPDIRFDAMGRCNYCEEFLGLLYSLYGDRRRRERGLKSLVERVREEGKGQEYDCMMGVSGGLDSSYALYQAKRLGLRPLAVHLDNGWNSELAVSNIERLCRNMKIELFTHVIDWEEFRDLQLSFFRAHVIDIEMLTDHAISAILYRMASERDIKYILAGTNAANEGMRMPPGWNHSKIDLRNILSIYHAFGRQPRLKSFPTLGIFNFFKYRYIDRIQWISLLDYVSYDREQAIQALNEAMGWRPYEKKHYESVFTRFYQGYILPMKFHVDKRRVHYSTLICSGQMRREEALELMKAAPYDNPVLVEEDKKFVLKKLGFSPEEFEAYLRHPGVPHTQYPSYEVHYGKLLRIRSLFRGASRS